METIDNLQGRVASIRSPFDKPAAERKPARISVLRFAVYPDGQASPSIERACCPRITQSCLDESIQQPNRFGAISGLTGARFGILGLGAIGLEAFIERLHQDIATKRGVPLASLPPVTTWADVIELDEGRM